MNFVKKFPKEEISERISIGIAKRFVKNLPKKFKEFDDLISTVIAESIIKGTVEANKFVEGVSKAIAAEDVSKVITKKVFRDLLQNFTKELPIVFPISLPMKFPKY